MTPKEILMQVRDIWRKPYYLDPGLVVITGGEPFRQHIGNLLDTFLHAGFYVQVESNGTMNPPEAPWGHHIDDRKGAYLVISPKTPKLNPLALDAASALKYVVAWDKTDLDGLPLSALGMKNIPCKPPLGWDRPVYIQPLDSKDSVENADHMAAAVRSSLEFGYILQLQVHKYIGVE
jgi:7-carboxy-7-deazaguanine synthase